MTEELTSELKAHMAKEHNIVEAYDGIEHSGNMIIYGRNRESDLIVGIHEREHQLGRADHAHAQ